VDRVECPIINDYQSAFEAYENEALDVISMITADLGTVARANRLYGRELVFTPQPSTFYLVIRVDRLPFSDVRVRRAFIHAVDRHTLFNVISQGQYVPATGGFIPPAMPGHSSGIGLTYDPERALDLLAQAGYPGGRGFPPVSWIYCGGEASEPVVPFLRKSWGTNLGLDIVAQNVEWKEFIERLEGDPASLTLTGWRADYQDPDFMLRVPFHSTEGINTPRWKNARFDSLVDKAAGVVDQNERIRLYQTADHILVAEQAAIMPLGYAQGRMLVKPWVTLPHIQPAMMPLKEVVLFGER
jgi:oligopeptide transport system substrate-binding protein